MQTLLLWGVARHAKEDAWEHVLTGTVDCPVTIRAKTLVRVHVAMVVWEAVRGIVKELVRTVQRNKALQYLFLVK